MLPLQQYLRLLPYPHVKLKEQVYFNKISVQLNRFKSIDPNDNIPTLTSEQLLILDEIQKGTTAAMTPLQRLEHSLHPFVTFIVLPIFAVANAGIALDFGWGSILGSNVAVGVGLGLLVGKVLGVVGFTVLLVKLKLGTLPEDMQLKHLFGLGFLASIGFTMSLFVTELAFVNDLFKAQAKIGIFVASIVGGTIGYIILNSLGKRKTA